jgi:predicted NAD/FAD-binding protein
VRIAVIGAGIAGIGSAWLLSPQNTVDVYEADDRLGGHAYTVDLTVEGTTFPADSGFQVFNTRTYPNLIRFFDILGIEWTETDMSFSVQVGAEHIEWSGTNLNSVFAQRANIVNPKFLSMLAGVLKFSRDADRLLADPEIDTITLGQLIEREGYSAAFIDWYLLPMGDAIWSTPPGLLLEYPAGTFLRFCDNHGLLHVTGKPMWRSVLGGSRVYVERAAKNVSGSVFEGEPVERIERGSDGVTVVTARRTERYDAVVIATHPPETLSMLAQPSDAEREVLGAFTYQPNGVTLHTDASFMPDSRRAWAAWNWYAETGDATKDMLTLTYWLNDLQEMPDGVPPVFETLNENRPFAEGSILEPMTFMHPLFTADAIAAQKRLPEIQGVDGVWYAGAWQRYGFHEDGLLSAVRVAEAMGAVVPWGDELDASRTRVLSPVSERTAAPHARTPLRDPAPETSS